MPRLPKSKILLGAAAIAIGIGATAYVQHGLTAAVTEQPAAKAAAALPVETVTIEKRPVRIWRSFSARLEAVDEVELRPQVSGRIVEVRFRDGQRVAKGDVLFVIEPRPFEAAVAQARADLDGAKERRTFAERELARARKLIRTNAVAERVLDQRANEFATAKSDVEAAAARLVQAEIDLDHAHVKAPIAGRVSRVEVTIGNIVEAGANAPLLTSIVSSDGIYADFEVDENTYLRYVRSAALDMASEQTIPVRLSAGSEGGEVVEGRIYAFDNRIDPRTGTIRARAHFANADGRLLPGMFARVKMGSATEQDAVLLTERAILTDQDRKYVYIVGPDNTAAYREVALGASISGKRVIDKGLQEGDQVIVGGLMVVRPNLPVEPRKATAQETGGAQANVAAGG
jgi:multidrug efflux system membrane fusion protein